MHAALPCSALVWLAACGPKAPPTTETTDPPALTPGVTTLAEIDAGTGGMALGPDGDIYMGDFGPLLSSNQPGARVFRISPDGQVSTFAEGFVGASGNTVRADGTLLQSNIQGGFVSSVSADGVVSTFATGFNAPVGLVNDPDRGVFVANCGSHTIALVSDGGVVSEFAASDLLKCPNGIAMAPAGDLYVSNFYNGDLLRIDGDGEVHPFVSLPGNNLGHVTWGNGRLYVANRGGQAIVSVSLDGEVLLVAGTGVRGAQDGDLDEATVSLTNDIAVSPDGRVLYFNDVHPESTEQGRISPTLVRRLVLPE